MQKPNHIDLGAGAVIPILHEDRSVLAIDKPAGWFLAAESLTPDLRNLHAALLASIQAGDYWARSRNLKYLRFVHRLDAQTSGVLLLVKSSGAVRAYSRLFERRQVEKVYWAIVHGVPRQQQWTCELCLQPDPRKPGRMRIWPPVNSSASGHNQRSAATRSAETRFRVLQAGTTTALIEARPLTGRTHQIRLHLAAASYPILGDELYGPAAHSERDLGFAAAGAPVPTIEAATANVAASVREYPLALRAVRLAYGDPFTKRNVEIRAPTERFVERLS